ncbi:hypothetical protein [Streptomyces sp. enrichment culture]|uniref:hypothetical protein n=1 Tax=Streptomyces sp. enrichment culture TaxID=1795815 RepID=UPI003F57CD03
MTPAAVAVIRAAIEDATAAELLHHPRTAAVRVAKALEDAGWDIAPTDDENGPQTAT